MKQKFVPKNISLQLYIVANFSFLVFLSLNYLLRYIFWESKNPSINIIISSLFLLFIFTLLFFIVSIIKSNSFIHKVYPHKNIFSYIPIFITTFIFYLLIFKQPVLSAVNFVYVIPLILWAFTMFKNNRVTNLLSIAILLAFYFLYFNQYSTHMFSTDSFVVIEQFLKTYFNGQNPYSTNFDDAFISAGGNIYYFPLFCFFYIPTFFFNIPFTYYSLIYYFLSLAVTMVIFKKYFYSPLVKLIFWPVVFNCFFFLQALQSSIWIEVFFMLLGVLFLKLHNDKTLFRYLIFAFLFIGTVLAIRPNNLPYIGLVWLYYMLLKQTIYKKLILSLSLSVATIISFLITFIHVKEVFFPLEIATVLAEGEIVYERLAKGIAIRINIAALFRMISLGFITNILFLSTICFGLIATVYLSLKQMLSQKLGLYYLLAIASITNIFISSLTMLFFEYYLIGSLLILNIAIYFIYKERKIQNHQNIENTGNTVAQR